MLSVKVLALFCCDIWQQCFVYIYITVLLCYAEIVGVWYIVCISCIIVVSIIVLWGVVINERSPVKV